jgi:hypothetical protein
MSTQGQLAKAQARLERATVRRDAEQARLDSRHWTELDSATGSGIRRKPNPKADARRFASYQRIGEVFTEFENAEKEVARLTSRLEKEQAESQRVRFTAADLAGAKGVRDRFGWHRVVKVNAKTVTVETPYSWTDRIPVENVLEVLREKEQGS